MASHTLSPSIWISLSNLFGRLIKHNNTRTDVNLSPDDLRAERENINEMFWSNPEVFSSEVDIQNMMYMYRVNCDGRR